ncbi:myb-like protein X [Oreochromis aureus]|uniref:myb-like protein X n=1 Tax=Oreochromis aureus TaxID=47969 RepID=UPI001953034E|nr:myb-like protein X [Oreochromis aureus]XP_039470376.1 myb-like protein X [Oreochromis aureus]XP_039470377.1 myb-like protein X [Oreochromis aureus]
MIDFEEADFILETQKRKRKKDLKKDKKHKTNLTVKPEESIQKKKKNSQLKEEKKERKQKKKEKKKEKQRRRLALELDSSVVFKQCSSAQEKLFEKPEASKPQQNEKLKPDRLTQDSKKKCKRKKKVVFDVSPCYIRVKRPKFASSSTKEEEAVKGAESCSQDAVTGNSQSCDQDSQGTSDDINSQDLFITQKTFRTSLSEPSSGEVSDGALMLSPQLRTQQGECQQLKLFHEESEKWPHGSQPHQRFVQPNPEEPEEGKGHHKIHEQRKRSFLKQENRNLSEEQRVSRSVHLKIGVGHPFLEEPIIVNSSLDLGESNTCPPNQRSPSCLPHVNKSLLPARSTVSSSTQTENFFTTELSSYLSFCQKSRPAVCFDDMKPLDLSLPHRVRKDRGSCLSVMEVNHEGEGGMGPSGSSLVKENQVLLGRGETTPSPQLSESDQKSADTTTSSEDSEQPCRAGKLDLIQVRAVQMKLNESFFFKPKGEGRSPRPESPLMKLSQGRDTKRRKSR